MSPEAFRAPGVGELLTGVGEGVGDRLVAGHLLALGEQLRGGLIAECSAYGCQCVLVEACLVDISGQAGLFGDAVGCAEEPYGSG